MARINNRPSNFSHFETESDRRKYKKDYQEDPEDKQLFPKPLIFAIGLPSGFLPIAFVTLPQLFSKDIVMPSGFSLAAFACALITLIVTLVFALVKNKGVKFAVGILIELIALFCAFIITNTYAGEMQNGTEFTKVLTRMTCLYTLLFPTAMLALFTRFENNYVVLSFIPLGTILLTFLLGFLYSFLGDNIEFLVTWLPFILTIAAAVGVLAYLFQNAKTQGIYDNKTYQENRRRNRRHSDYDDDEDY